MAHHTPTLCRLARKREKKERPAALKDSVRAKEEGRTEKGTEEQFLWELSLKQVRRQNGGIYKVFIFYNPWKKMLERGLRRRPCDGYKRKTGNK